MWSDLLCRLRSLLRRESVERELNDELQFHIERQAEKHMKSGLTREDADRRARLDFGREQQMKEECREARGISQIDITLQDLRNTAKSLARSPAFTIVVVLTLGIGIAANAAIFAQVNAVILKTLPVRHPKELKQLEWTSSNNNGFATRVGGNTGRRNAAGSIREAFSYRAYASLRDQSKSFASLLCYRDSLAVNVMVADHSERAFAQPVSGNYFETLGVSALIGRTITLSDEQERTAVAVVSHGFWERVLNSDPTVLGVTLTIDGTPFVVIGVTDNGFFGIDPLNPADIMIPLQMVAAVGLRDAVLTDSRDWSAWRVVGRLRPEVSEGVARAESEVLVRQTIPNEVAIHEMPQVWISGVERGLGTLRGATSQSLLILMAAAALILLIACANIAGLLLARISSRRKELGTRLALGASRRRVVRQIMTESLVLSSIGGGLSILFSYPLARAIPTPVQQFGIGSHFLGVSLSPDLRVILLSIALSTIIGIALGLTPAVRATKLDLFAMIKQGSADVPQQRVHITGRKALVTVQVGLSFVLLMGSALFVETVRNLRTVDLGFKPEGLLVFSVDPKANGYSDGYIQSLYKDLSGRIQNLPGVVAVSMSNQPLLTGSVRTRPCVPGLAAAASANVDSKLVSLRFFETWGIRLMSGRDFLPADTQAPGRAIVVNEAFARRFYEGKNPIDQTLGLCPDETGVRIVGIVSDVRTINMRVSGNPTMYIFEPTMNSPTIAVRTAADPSAFVPALRQLIKELDPTLPMTNVSTEGEVRDSVMFQERALSDLMTGFAAIAVFLSCLGIYGLLSYLVSQRTSEIGIRMALGARPGQVLQMILRESLFPAGLGLVLGLASALELTGFVENMLFGIPRNDPATMVIVALVLLLAVGVASAIPAWRATLVDPLATLRND